MGERDERATAARHALIMSATQNSIAEVLSSPNTTARLTFVQIKILKLLVTNLELLKSIVPLCMLADGGSNTEFLIVMDIDAEGAACGLRHPRRINMGMEEFLVVVLVFFLQEQGVVYVLCI